MPGHQATCVAIGDRAVLIEGPPGSGKSMLALKLIDRGARLIGDDSVMLESDVNRLVARPHPETRGLIEVRNLGIVRADAAGIATCAEAAVCLTVRLDDNAPRYVEAAERACLHDHTIPLLRLSPGGDALALKVELGLRLFGLMHR